MFLRLLCLSTGWRHQEWKGKSSEQADGARPERDQRQSWPSFGEKHFTREDVMIEVGIFITEAESNGGMRNNRWRTSDIVIL